MNITNPQAVNFSNTKARTLADLIERMDRTIDTFLLDVVQDFENHTGGNADGDVITSDISNDNRNPVTKLDMAEFKYVVEQLKACMDTSDRRAVVHQLVVNGQPIY